MNKSSRTLRNLAWVALVGASTPVAHGLVTQSGDFASYVDTFLRPNVFTSGSNLYIAPTAQQRSDFRSLASSLYTGDYATADAQAIALNYQLVLYSDTTTGRSYYLLREGATSSAFTRGWGSFAISPGYTANALVEVPHPLADSFTETLGAWSFQRSGARGFLLAGAHRDTNGFGTADVARTNIESIFNEVHQAWSGPSAVTTAYQIHGFDESGFSFPSDTSAVLSDGAGTVTQRIRNLDTQLRNSGLVAYNYNTLSLGDPSNVAVNTSSTGTVFAGSTFSPLGATTNYQGQYARGIGGTFVHAEFAQSVRFSTSTRSLAATAVASAIAGTTSSTALWDGGAGDSPASWTAASGANFSPNGLPSNVSVVLDTSLVTTLPADMRLTATSTTLNALTWNAPTSGTLSNDTPGATNSVITLTGGDANGVTPILSVGSDAISSTFTLSGTNTASGTPGTGVLSITVAGPGPIQVVNPGAALRIGAVINESGGSRRLEKTGAGTLFLDAATNNFTGGIRFTSGIVSFANVTSTGPSPTSAVANFYEFNGGTLQFTGAAGNPAANRGVTILPAGAVIDVPTATSTISFSGIIANSTPGVGLLVKTGPGQLTLANSGNTWTAGLQISGGTVQISNGNALGTAPTAPTPNVITFDGGFLRWGFTSSPALNANRGFTVTTNNGGIDVPLATGTLSYAGVITGPGTFQKIGPGGLTLTGTNLHLGGINVLNGFLTLQNALGLGPAPDTLNPTQLVLNNTRLQFIGNTVTFSGTRGITLNGGGTIDVTNAATTLTLAGPIAGTGPLIKAGPGILLLTGSSSFTGQTQLTAGTLGLSTGFALGATPTNAAVGVVVSPNTTLQANGSFTLSANRQIQITSPGTAAFDVPNPSDTATFAGAITGDGFVKTGPGTLQTTRSQVTAVTVAAGTWRLTPDFVSATAVGSLTISPGGLVDITNSTLIVRNAGATGLTSLRASVSAALTGSTTGITSSLASPASGNFTTLAVFLNSGTLPYFSAYQNVPGLTSNDVLIKYTWTGDTNLDGVLTGTDLANVIEGLSTPNATGWQRGDLNYDGVVTLADLQLFNNAYAYYNSLGSNAPNYGSGAGVLEITGAVPEPAALGLLALAAVPLARTRRRAT